MSSTIELNGKIYKRGSTVILNSKAPAMCHAPAGLKVELRYIHREGGGNCNIGLYSRHKEVKDWSDLDGEVPHRKGWWVRAANLEQCIDTSDVEYVVKKELRHRGTELKDKPCRWLATLEDGSIFVEFEEDVNGCSADGLGKAGYCVAIKSNALAKRKREKHAK